MYTFFGKFTCLIERGSSKRFQGILFKYKFKKVDLIKNVCFGLVSIETYFDNINKQCDFKPCSLFIPLSDRKIV